MRRAGVLIVLAALGLLFAGERFATAQGPNMAGGGGGGGTSVTGVDGVGTPSANAMVRYRNSRLEEAPGTAVSDDGIVTVDHLTVADGGAIYRTFKSGIYNFTPGGAKFGFDFTGGSGNTPTAFNADSPLEVDAGKVVFLNSANPLVLHSLTAGIGTTTAAGMEDEELFFFSVYGCPAASLTASGPGVSGCTEIDRIVFEVDTDGTADTTYGTGPRTAITCATANAPCAGSVTLDGNGLSPAGDPSVAAGTYLYLILGAENDDASWTLDAATDIGASSFFAQLSGSN